MTSKKTKEQIVDLLLEDCKKGFGLRFKDFIYIANLNRKNLMTKIVSFIDDTYMEQTLDACLVYKMPFHFKKELKSFYYKSACGRYDLKITPVFDFQYVFEHISFENWKIALFNNSKILVEAIKYSESLENALFFVTPVDENKYISSPESSKKY